MAVNFFSISILPKGEISLPIFLRGITIYVI